MTASFDATARPGGSTRGGRESLRDVLVDAEQRLARAGVPSPSYDAAALAAHVIGVPRLRLRLQDRLGDAERVRLEQLLIARAARVPLQHLLGVAAFRRIELRVGAGVFIPRPETELVAETALRLLPVGGVAVDLGTGSGALALSLAVERRDVVVHAVERDPAAMAWARRNVAELAGDLTVSGSQVQLHQADATTAADPGGPLSGLCGRVDVVVSNPPYIPDHAVPRDPEVRDHDPAAALYGGPDGLDTVRGIARTAALLLPAGGSFVLEHGDEQGEAAKLSGVPGLLRAMVVDDELALAQHGLPGQPVWSRVVDRADLNRRPRFTVATRA
ncbi:MAG: peptide chain release factor N(5)-glutamine methyltransferase [Actinomycetota bacterium]|nr:MAG: peptide chain release factor N(5)-glutamine methyltransferase [Actinomycetota bacterium]